MDFFEYASVASAFVNTLWTQLLVGGLCFAIVFIFQAIALYTIAVREGYGNKWMAFVPFLNTYYIGVCSQKNKFYNISAKTLGLVTAIFEFVLFIFYIVYYTACYLVIDYEIPVKITGMFGVEVIEYQLSDNVPENLAWAAWMYNYLEKFILRYVDLVYIVFEIFLLVCFFQTFACRRYVLFTFASVLFPIQGILFFVLRNNKAMNYKDFVRNEQARQYRMYQQYQQQQNMGQNPYNGNVYNPPEESKPSSAPEDPFEGFGSSDNKSGDNDPFDEFKS